ncbi:20786_t:CDS:1, partial [Dentiscutata erythropus]
LLFPKPAKHNVSTNEMFKQQSLKDKTNYKDFNDNTEAMDLYLTPTTRSYQQNLDIEAMKSKINEKT